MATLPDVSAFGERPVPQSGGSVIAYQPRKANVESFSRAGRDLEEMSGMVAQMNERQDAMTAQSAANQLTARSISLQHDEKTGFVNIKGGSAVGPEFVKGWTQNFKDAQDQIRGSLTNENQKRVFDQHAEVTNLHFQGSLLQHQAVQTNTFNNDTENGTIDLARRAIFQSPGDGEALQAGFAQIDWAIDQKARRLGWSVETTAHTKAEYASKVYEDVAGMSVERDPRSALAAMNMRLGIGQPAQNSGVPAIDSLSPEKLVHLHHRANAYVMAKGNRDAALEEQRIRLAEDAFHELEQFTLTGQPVSQDYERRLTGLTADSPWTTQTQTLIQASFAGSTFGTKTLTQQEQDLRQIDAAVSATGTDPQAAKLVSKMREIHNAQKAAYTENPYAAATRFARVPETPEQSVGDLPALIKARLPVMTGVEVAAGGPISPLQPNEAKAYIERLKTLQPDAAAKELGQAGTMLSLPRLEAFANQIDKHDKPMALALKMGTDGTTAGRPVGELLLRGAQALKDKTIKRDDAVLTGWRSEISSLVRGTLGDAKAEDDAIDAAYYVRAALDADASKTPGYKFDTSAASAVRFAVGVPIERNGVKTILPREMDEDIFDQKLKAFTPEVLRSMAAPSGQLAPGNIDLTRRPQVKNADGSVSTIRSIGVNIDGREVLIPTVSPDGKVLSNADAIKLFQTTGQHLGVFSSPEASTAYAQRLHGAQADLVTGKGSGAPSATFYVRGQPITAEKLSGSMDRLGMRRAGGGRYVPSSGGAFVTLDPQGQVPLKLPIQ